MENGLYGFIFLLLLASSEANRRAKRIIGLDDNGMAQEKQFPYQAQIRIGSSIQDSHYKCGGTIIGNFHILSAARCLEENGYFLRPEFFLVVVGNLLLDGSDGVSYDPLKYYVKLETSPTTRSIMNIAVIQVENAITWTDKISPASLPVLIYHQRNLTVAGWGCRTPEQRDEYARDLMFAEIRFDTVTRGGDTLLYSSLGVNNGIRMCDGDAGNGAVGRNDEFHGGRHAVFGFFSDSKELRNGQRIDVYTNVFKYRDWIRSIMNGRPDTSAVEISADSHYSTLDEE